MDPGEAFELPARARDRFAVRSPWSEKAGVEEQARAGARSPIRLEPFQVLTLECTPA